jgi:hypothetical protein
MIHRIIESIDNPEMLEKLYRENRNDFYKSLLELPGDYNSDLVKFWKVRLANETEINQVSLSKKDWLVVMLLSLVNGILVKLPELFSQFTDEFFYTRNLAIIAFNGVILYTFWQNQFFEKRKIAIYAIMVLLLTVFLNFLPSTESDSVVLSLIHAPLLLWCMFGLSYMSFDYNNIQKRIEFIRFNGELIIMNGLILLAGGLLTAITIGLFSALKMNVEKFYFEYIVLVGAVASPIVSMHLIRFYPSITSKVAPVIARTFTPLVLITLAAYLITLIFSNARIIQDRDLLLILNAMLVGVMAIIVFSISELDKLKERNINALVLFLLAVLAIAINSIALVAIVTRVTYGLTPNRIVVLVSNVLIFVNLLLIAKDLYKSYFLNKSLENVEHTVAKYLTVYAVWTAIVVFLLPFIFGMR